MSTVRTKHSRGWVDDATPRVTPVKYISPDDLYRSVMCSLKTLFYNKSISTEELRTQLMCLRGEMDDMLDVLPPNIGE